MLEEVVGEQRDRSKLIDEVAVLVDHAKPVGIAVVDDANGGARVANGAAQVVGLGRDRFRSRQAGKPRVPIRVDLGQLQVSAAKDAAEPSGA